MPADSERYRIAGALEILTSDGGLSLRVTTHCVDRFWERAAVGATTFADARARLQLLTREIGEMSDVAPDWVYNCDDELKWILLGPDVVLMVDRRLAVTCLSRGSFSDAARTSRNLVRRKRRSRITAAQRKRQKPTRRWDVDEIN